MLAVHLILRTLDAAQENYNLVMASAANQMNSETTRSLLDQAESAVKNPKSTQEPMNVAQQDHSLIEKDAVTTLIGLMVSAVTAKMSQEENPKLHKVETPALEKSAVETRTLHLMESAAQFEWKVDYAVYHQILSTMMLDLLYVAKPQNNLLNLDAVTPKMLSKMSLVNSNAVMVQTGQEQEPFSKEEIFAATET
jgi:hypothetical protein